MSDAPTRSLNFIEQIIEADNAAGRWGAWSDGRPRVCTRFPPEPNGYLHIGHAKSICLNYGLAARYGGQFNLRFDDTNPVKEEQEYVDSIIEDVRWLGARWPKMSAADKPSDAGVLYASDYFGQICEWGLELIRKGKAYVCDCSADEIRRARGALTRPGANCAHRERAVDENLALFERMRKGEFPDGSRTLRAKIDMASPNLNLRDPVMYRILHSEHHRQGDQWCVYPMYDWAHGFEDSIEGITHSICTLEFENHRPLYDWFIAAVNEGRTADGSGPWGRRIHHPQQIEFARLNVSYMVMSKRKLLHLVKGGHVDGWDDPRMPTISGLRRRGVTPESIREFCEQIGVAKFNGVIELAKLESCIRDDLNKRAPRVMAVVRPLKVVIENWPDEAQVDWLDAVNNPEDPSAGSRKVPLGKVLYIERDDFMETPPKGYFRLAPGAEVRLRYAYFVRCTSVWKDPNSGEVIEVRCNYDPATRGGDAPDGRKVKGTIHWVSAAQAVDAEVRLCQPLFYIPDPESAAPETETEAALTAGATAAAASGATLGASESWMASLNPGSLQSAAAKLEPNWRDAAMTAKWTDGITRVQFERVGYFCLDRDSTPQRLVFNRTVTLKDSWAKQK